jgi:hypothetical protein
MMPSTVEHTWGRLFLWSALVLAVAGVITSGGDKLHLGNWNMAVPLGRAVLWTIAVVWLFLGLVLRLEHRGLLGAAAIGFLILIPLYFSPQPSAWFDQGYRAHCPSFSSGLDSNDEACFAIRSRRDTMIIIVGLPTVIALVTGITLGAVRERKRVLSSPIDA